MESIFTMGKVDTSHVGNNLNTLDFDIFTDKYFLSVRINLERLDMTDRPNVLFFDFAAELAENFDTDVTGSVYSVEICVKECPTGIVSHDDLYQGMGQPLIRIQSFLK